jgi:ATPase subunit of ABC transporter with duplicated ATPase domains
MRLSANELSIGYRNYLVGSGVDLALTAGEVLGQNGAGKTTLFRTLLGLNPALGGAVLLDDKAIDRMRPAETARHRRCAADRAPHQPRAGKRDQLRARSREPPPRATNRTSPIECDHRDSGGVRGPGRDDQSCSEMAHRGR